MFLHKKKKANKARKLGTSTPNEIPGSNIVSAPSGASSIQGGEADSCPISSRDDINDHWDDEINDSFSFEFDRTSPPIQRRVDTPSLDSIREALNDIREHLNGVDNIALQVDTNTLLSKVDQLSKELNFYMENHGSNSLVVELDNDINEIRSVLTNALNPPHMAQGANGVDPDTSHQPVVYPPAPAFRIYHDSMSSAPPVPTPRTSRGTSHEAGGQQYVSPDVFKKEVGQIRRSIVSSLDRFKHTELDEILDRRFAAVEASIAGKLSASTGRQIDSARNAFALRSDQIINNVDSAVERLDELEGSVNRLLGLIPGFSDNLEDLNRQFGNLSRSNLAQIEQFSARVENTVNTEINSHEMRINEEMTGLRQVIDNNQEAYVRRLVNQDTRSLDRLAGIRNELEDLQGSHDTVREIVLSLRDRIDGLNLSSDYESPETNSILGIRSVGENLTGLHPTPTIGRSVPPGHGPIRSVDGHSGSPRLPRPTPTLYRRNQSPHALSDRSPLRQQHLATLSQNGTTLSGIVPSPHSRGGCPAVSQPQPSPRSLIGQATGRPIPSPRVIHTSPPLGQPLPRHRGGLASNEPLSSFRPHRDSTMSRPMSSLTRGGFNLPRDTRPANLNDLNFQSLRSPNNPATNLRQDNRVTETVRPQFIPSPGRGLPPHSSCSLVNGIVDSTVPVRQPGPSLCSQVGSPEEQPPFHAEGLRTFGPLSAPSQGGGVPPRDSHYNGVNHSDPPQLIGHRTPPLADSGNHVVNPGHGPPPPSPSSSPSSLSSAPSRQPPPIDRSQAVDGAGFDPRIGRLSRRLEVCSGLIKKITDKNLECLSKSQVMELVTYDLKTLQELKKELSDIEKKLDTLHCAGASPLLDIVDDSIYSCRRFEGELEDLRKLHFLHLSADRSLLKKLELNIFDGKAENDTVYSFLSLFFRLTDGQYSPMDQASLLFTTYLSESIKREVEPFKDNLNLIKQHLITKYGDLRNVADSKVKAMSKVKHPGQPIPSQVDYYKRIIQLLLHLETLMASEYVNSSEIRGVIHSASYVNNIVALLPESIEHDYCRNLQDEPKAPPPSGERMFQLLKKTLEDGLGYLNSRSNIRQYATIGTRQDSSKSKSVHLAEGLSECSSPGIVEVDSPPKRIKKKSVNTASVQRSSSISFPCHFHTDTKKNGKHDLGYCKAFFEMKAEDRFKIAKQQALCFTCLKPECRKVSARTCISNIPDGLICQECAKGKHPRTLNVLLCVYDHEKPSLKDLEPNLVKYFKAFNKINLQHLKPAFNLMIESTNCNKSDSASRSSRPKSLSSPVDSALAVPHFDTTSGSVIDIQCPNVESSEDSVYLFQVIKVLESEALLFYDSGATGNVIRGAFAESAGFKVIDAKNQRIGAFGNKSLWTDFGRYKAVLGSEDDEGFELVFQGISEITSEFPPYSWTTVNKEVQASGKLQDEILPVQVGGRSADILIGIKTPELVPKLLFVMPSGIGVFRCRLKDVNGSCIAYGGSHECISRVNATFSSFSVNHMTIMLSRMAAEFSHLPWFCPIGSESPELPVVTSLSSFQSNIFGTTPLCGNDLWGMSLIDESSPGLDSVVHSHDCNQHHSCLKAKISLDKKFQVLDPENDHLVTYRCQKCQDCEDCKSSPLLQTSSLKSRAESQIVKNSIRLSVKEKKTFIKFPWLSEPISFFMKHFGGKNSNYDQALSVYKRQCSKNNELKDGIRKAFEDLVERDFLGKLSEAPQELRELIESAIIWHFFPWHAVLKISRSTPVRLVVDGSSSFLNLNVAKGESGLNNMFTILLSARNAEALWLTDITKMYNCLYLEPECAPYALVLFHDELSKDKDPDIYYMKRGWYGARSTAPQSSETFNQLGDFHKESHPRGSVVLKNKAYADDISSGTSSRKHSDQEVKEVEEILNNGGFFFKFVVHSGESPPEEASSDGKTVTMLGYLYTTAEDTLSLNTKDMHFAKKNSWSKPPIATPVHTPEDVDDLLAASYPLNRRQVVGKAAEIFDPLGLYEPFKAALKRSLSEISHLDWKDSLPQSQQDIWSSHLRLWPDLRKITFPRSTIPTNAQYPLECRLICVTDASRDCGGACIYVSYRLNDQKFSARLLASKSRLLKFSVPRNELEAIEIGVELVFATVVSLETTFTEIIIGTDSMVAMCWCHNENIQHKVYVMNRVLAINRFLRWTQDRVGKSCRVNLAHIPGEQNIADILTKGPPNPDLLKEGSDWQCGTPWMKGEVSAMPLTQYSDISLSKADQPKYQEELISADLSFCSDNQRTPGVFVYPVDNEFGESLSCVVSPPSSSHTTSSAHTAPSLSRPAVFSFFGEGLHVMQETVVQGKPVVYLNDVVRLGWARSNRQLNLIVKQCILWLHKTHLSTKKFEVKQSLIEKCPLCNLLLHFSSTQTSSVAGFSFDASETDTTVVGPGPLNKPTMDTSLTDGTTSTVSRDVFLSSTTVGSEVSSSLTKMVLGVDKGTQLFSVSPTPELRSIYYTQILDRATQIIVDFYWNYRSSLECVDQLSKKELKSYEWKENILFYKGRLGNSQSISVHDLELLDLKFLDSNTIAFNNPCVMASSPIFYAFAVFCHFNGTKHGGTEHTLREIQIRFHPIRARRTLNILLKDCIKCKIIRKKVLEHEMSVHDSVRLTFAPPFSYVQIDLAQNFHCKTRISGRETHKAPALVVVCLLTGGVGIYMLENWETESVVKALTRHSNKSGIPSVLYIDAGSQLKALKSASFDIQDLSHTLFRDMRCTLAVAPPKAHETQGRVERKIKSIKDMLVRLGEPKFLMSFLDWETLFSSISNTLNDLPIARASGRSVQRPEYSILTPNRLLLGRNNARSLAGPLILDSRLSTSFGRALEAQECFYNMLKDQIVFLIPKSKWYTSDEVFPNDYVLFFLDDSPLKSSTRPWHLGRVLSVSGQRLSIEYCIGISKKVLERSKRTCVRIASEEELIFNTVEHKDKVVKLSA